MADGKVVDWGFEERKLLKRRPSKRETTKRPFVLVKNWQSNSSEKVSPSIPESLQSPQFPRQSSLQSRPHEVNNNGKPFTAERIDDENGNKISESASPAISIVPGTPSASPLPVVQSLPSINRQTTNKTNDPSSTEKSPTSEMVTLQKKTPKIKKRSTLDANTLSTTLGNSSNKDIDKIKMSRSKQNSPKLHKKKEKLDTPIHSNSLSATEESQFKSQDIGNSNKNDSELSSNTSKLQEKTATKITQNTTPTQRDNKLPTASLHKSSRSPVDNSNIAVTSQRTVTPPKNKKPTAAESNSATPLSTKKAKRLHTNRRSNVKDFDGSNNPEVHNVSTEKNEYFQSVSPVSNVPEQQTTSAVADEETASVMIQKTPLSSQAAVSKEGGEESRVVVRRRGRPPKQKKETEKQNVQTEKEDTMPPEKRKRGRKRKHDKDDGDTNENTTGDTQQNDGSDAANRFVRIFNADQGRKVTVSEITDLDVILTAIEEEALEYREEVGITTESQCIKEFFIQTRKAFGYSIDLQKELKGLKTDLRKAKSQLNKRRSELLDMQSKRTRLKEKLDKIAQEQQHDENNTDLSEINNFVKKMKSIQKKCPTRTSHVSKSKVDLPSALCQMQSLLTSLTNLKAINSSLEQWLANQ